MASALIGPRAEAIAACRAYKAKLDRLSRNAHFLLGLQEAGVEFVAVDIPFANRLTVGIMALMAEHEGQMISERTKAALAAAKSARKSNFILKVAPVLSVISSECLGFHGKKSSGY